MKPQILKSFMGLHECEILQQYLQLRANNGKVAKRNFKSGKRWEVHCSATTDAIGLTYKRQVEDVFKTKLSLSSTCLRKFAKDSFVGWHRNKWNFEYVVAIQVSDNTWAAGFANKQDNPVIEGLQGRNITDFAKLTALQGDAIAFNGSTTYHGRRSAPTDCTILYLYYVEENQYLDTKAGREKYGEEFKTKIDLHGEVKFDA